ncbi:sensor histidine kinase KdpD [Synechococcus sp. UW179A]|uniref:sensor histidine kinase n=1 Tax=Synechococcus sp. UW179A TaxID=2575510 RepID=UPI001FCAED02|nr:HAMP domain-containing sensor histidine kinase [Synechococcus sp. UW179A]
MNHQPLPSLRTWLQSTAVLTVVAGYSVLLVLNGALSDLQRRQHHEQLVQSLARQAAVAQLDPVPLRNFGLEASLLAEGSAQKPRLQRDVSGQQWLVSRQLMQLPSGEQRWLQLRQNVTSSLEQQRLAQSILLSAAGLSILFTALLLRPVIRRGLLVPLDDFDQQLQTLEADNLGEHLLDPQLQPQELRAIAVAFNNLQQRLAAAWRRERAFVDGVAHELRTPITVISGHSQRLQREALPASAQRSADLINAEAARIADLLRVLRDLALIDSGRLQLDYQSLDPDDQLLLAYESLSADSNGRLQLPQPAGELRPALWADSARVQQCLQALIRNALLYSSGIVRLQTEQSCDGLILHVIDQGDGIAEVDRSVLLQRFKRGVNSAGTRGMGIGLALVHELMQVMQGELLINDAEGGGADVQLRFRLAAAGQ